MSVYKPAKSPYFQYDFRFKGHRFHGSTGKTTEREARAAEKVVRDAAIMSVLSGKIAEPVTYVPTLDEAAAEWWDARGSGLKSADTLETRLASAVELVGKTRPINTLTTSDMAKAIQKRRGKLTRHGAAVKNATANRDIIDTLRPIIRRQRKLLNDGKGPPVHFPEIDWSEVRLAEPKPRPRDFSGDEVQASYAALPHWWRDFAGIQARYGCRLAEMFFSLPDIDMARARVRLRDRKGDDDHYLPLLAEDLAMLAARVGRAKAAKINTVWFRELKGGRLKALTYGGAKQAIRRAMRSSGLHAAHGAKGSHDYRHHAAMQFLRHTKDIRSTQRLLGHADLNSTLVYAHALEGDVRAGLEGLARAIDVGSDTSSASPVLPTPARAESG